MRGRGKVRKGEMCAFREYTQGETTHTVELPTDHEQFWVGLITGIGETHIEVDYYFSKSKTTPTRLKNPWRVWTQLASRKAAEW